MDAARGFKRRAAIACDYCKWRKIKCNVEDGDPCSNCQTTNIECTISHKSKRRKKATLEAADTSTVSKRTTPENEYASQLLPQNIHLSEARSVVQTNASMQTQRSGMIRNQENSMEVTLIPADSFEPRLLVQEPNNGNAVPIHDQTRGPEVTNPSAAISPTCLDSIPNHLPVEDIEYLARKGSLDIPDTNFRNASIRCYADFIHPYMPLLDLEDFGRITGEFAVTDEKFSLLLFQAVIFAGSAHIDVKLLRTLGFLTRKSARKSLFHRVKALYDLHYESKRIPIIQSLLLMSLWYETPDDEKDAYHWLTIAVSMAKREGLDCDPTSLNLSSRESSLRKRIWWSCVVRDPLVAIGLRRPISISTTEYRVPMLRLEDLDVEHNTINTESECLFNSPSYKKLNRHKLFSSCIKQVELCKCLGAIIGEQYAMTPSHRQISGNDVTNTKMIIQPLTNDRTYVTVTTHWQRLRTWYNSIPQEWKSLGNFPSSDNSDALTVYTAVLLMLYHTAVITLLRPWISKNSSSVTQASGAVDYKSESRASARAITEIAVTLHNLDLTKHVPQTGLTALVSAVAIHIQDIGEVAENDRVAGIRGLEQCSHLIQELRDNFYSADFSTIFTNIAARTAKLHPHAVVNKCTTLAQKLCKPSRSGRSASDTELPVESRRLAHRHSVNPATIHPRDTQSEFIVGGSSINNESASSAEIDSLEPLLERSGMDDFEDHFRAEYMSLLGDFTIALDDNHLIPDSLPVW